MSDFEKCPLTTLVRIVYRKQYKTECMEVYQQKISSSDEYICISQDESPVGQHMLDFLSVSTAELPPILTEMEKLYAFITSHNFDHHLVPVYIDNIIQCYLAVRNIHCWWASCLPTESLWEDFQDYYFYSIHPSPYLLDTYDEVDRLMSEESSWRCICDRLQDDIRWLNMLMSKIHDFNDAITCCLDSSSTSELSHLNATQRAFLFQSYFDDLFINRSAVRSALLLSPQYVTPLGKSVQRKDICLSGNDQILQSQGSNMSYRASVANTPGVLTLGTLAEMLHGMTPELLTVLTIESPTDIFSLCSFSLYQLIDAEVKIRRCRNCGQYFIPLNRSDEIYCSRVQKNGKTCKAQNYSERIDSDVLLSIYRKAYKTHNARKQRNKNNHINADVEFKEWVSYAKSLHQQAAAGSISPEQFEELLRK